jgi:hypothetical protein
MFFHCSLPLHRPVGSTVGPIYTYFFYFHGVTARGGPKPPYFWDFIPNVFLVGKCAFCSEWPAQWPHKFLLNPDETARAIWQAVRRLGWEMAALNFAYWFYSCPKVLLHAVNLRHGTDGFTSSPKEVVLRIFITLKNPSTSVGIEPANLGSNGEHANH